MDIVLRRRKFALIDAASDFFNRKRSNNWLPSEPFEIVWWILAFVVSISLLPSSISEASPFLTIMFAILGAAGCGWIWLLSRSLFRSNKNIEYWNLGVIGFVVLVEAIARLSPTLLASGVNGEILRIFSNAEVVVCISMIAFVFVEACNGYKRGMPVLEKLFRQVFIVGFGAIIMVAIVWGANADQSAYGAEWVDRIAVVSGVIAILGTRLAVEFRKRNPLQTSDIHRPSRASVKREKDEVLSQRILLMSEDITFLAKENLRLTDMATHLGVQDYLVTQCITNDLGFRNFNHLINTYRVNYAKIQLSDLHGRGKKISSIAFDCGFNSIGTFNRAFKNEVGVTPREFRLSAIDTATMPCQE